MTVPDVPHAKPAAEWVYRGLWRILVRWLRVPKEPPTLPVAPGEKIVAFQADPAFLRYLKLWFWLLLPLGDVIILVGWIAVTVAIWWLGLILLPVALVLAIAPDIVVYVALHVRYDTTWYVFTDRSLRIRRGVWIIQEMTITFENVQNLKVSQGPIERAFGISRLVVETAGSGGGDPRKGQTGMNAAVIEGVKNAADLRERIMVRLRKSRGAGLGDLEDDEHLRAPAGEPPGSRRGWTAEHLAVLREIRDIVTAG